MKELFSLPLFKWGFGIISYSDGTKIVFTYNGQNYYYLKNAQDDITGIVDRNCNIVVKYTYDAWDKLFNIHYTPVIGGAGKGSKNLMNLGKQTVKRTVNTLKHRGLKATVKNLSKVAGYYAKSAKSFYADFPAPVFACGHTIGKEKRRLLAPFSLCLVN